MKNSNISIMRINKYIGMMMLAAGIQAATSCTDFDDYNEAFVDPLPGADKTLWENISENPNLTKFATLAERAGFKDDLQASRFYTVWAPLDNAINMDEYANADSAQVLERFIRNHVADYNHIAIGALDERIYALNDKAYDFVTGDGGFLYGDVKVQDANIPSINGVMHTLNGVVGYYPNIYTYLFEMTGADELQKMFVDSDIRELNLDKSIIGPIVDGKQTYIDSVMDTRNLLAEKLRADFDCEDSTYTILIPNNEAWAKQYDKIKTYFNYIEEVPYETFIVSSSNTEAKSKTGIAADYMRDSLAKEAIVDALVYNNRDMYNAWMTNDEALFLDTIRTTTRSYFSNPNEILSHTVGEPLKMSNGYARVIDTLAVRPWELYAPSRSYPASNHAAHVLSGSGNRLTGEQIDKWGELTDFNYLWIEPSSPYSVPQLYISLPNVQSAKYRFYCVFVPSRKFENTTDTLPNLVNFELSYSDAKGEIQKEKFDASKVLSKLENPTDEDLKDFYANGTLDKKYKTAFINDTTVIDTMFIGEFTFPVSYMGLADQQNSACAPYIKITTPFNGFNAAYMKKFARSLRIASIIVKPVELVEYQIANGIVKE